MAMHSSGSKGKALQRYQDSSRDDSRVYRFQVLLPNGMSINLMLRNPGEEMLVQDFLLAVKREMESTPMDDDEGRPREMNWGTSIYITDLLDRNITNKIVFSNYDTKSLNILTVHDEMGGSVSTYENMWDLTPQTDLLQELPAEYSTESALLDLIDNSLQAVWSNGASERKLIKINIDKEKIVIFDTGRGMDGSYANSISKWGTMGSSNHRAFRDKGIGGKAPYLLPFFGLFGYGGTIASMHLGRIAVVSSKTKESTKVFTLHLSRDALLNNSKLTWKTKGGVRDPSQEEISLSPHQSFTQVEICGLKRCLDLGKIRGFLKDIYFPYIQYDEDNKLMNTRNPVEFEVNGLNLTEIQEGEVTITNLHSSNGEDFILQLHMTTASDIRGAHARLKCVYFPITEGKESIDHILEKLRNDGYGMEETFNNFSRVSIRRLGRLLPDARWGTLPFMEPKNRKGQKAELFKRCCKRVKCFIETDAGFYPTLSKTDLGHHNPFTKALRCLGGGSFNNCSAGDVTVEVRDKLGSLLSNKQLEKQYYDWIMKMHDNYDVEMDGGNDEPTLILNPSSKERLGISKDVEVIRVHTSINRKGKIWRRGDHLKILRGVIGRMKSKFSSSSSIFYGTLEYIVVEGLPGDVCGEARLICRPIECPEEQGCLLDEAEGCMRPNPDIYIQDSVSFPVSIIDDKKCQIIDDDSWNQKLKKQKEKAPAWIEVVGNLEGNSLGIGGYLPFEDAIVAGYEPPQDIVAVVRPGNCSTGLLEQKYIVKDDDLEMVMEIRQMPRSKDCSVKLIDRKVQKPSCYGGINGLYIFPLREASSIFTESGEFQFIFSVRCRDASVIQHETSIRVCPDANSRYCQIFNVADCSGDSTPVDIRLGCPVRGLAVRSVDLYGNRIPFHDISSVIITILGGDGVLVQVDDVKVELSSDLLTLHVMDFLFETRKLDVLRPKYKGMLKVSSSDNEFTGICRCKVQPGLPSTITMDISKDNLIPGRVIDDALFEVFDHLRNHVEEGTELNVHVDGLCFLDKPSSDDKFIKVNGEGLIDLSGTLRVVNGFGSQVCIMIFYHEKMIFSLVFHVAIRELKAVDVPESCPAGSTLYNMLFEISDSDGLVDEFIDGPLHTLKLTSNELQLVEGAEYAIKHGRCVVSHVQLPHGQGTVTIQAHHTHYPDLRTTIQLQVHATDLALTSLDDGPEPIISYPISIVKNSNLALPGQFTPVQPSCLVKYVKDSVEETSNGLEGIQSKISSIEKTLETLFSREESLEQEISVLKDEIDPMAGAFVDAKELTCNKIRERIGTAAYVLCSSGECWMNDVVGIVALLGTVSDNKIGKMLAAYLGKDEMLSLVCKTLEATNYIEKYNANGDVDVSNGIHEAAAALGAPIRSRFPIICLEAIEPYKGDLSKNSPEKELALASPFGHGKGPQGFKGFAVNMIHLSDENLNIRTSGGHGLRETLFYSLFGELQVYETRKDMLQAMPYLKGGAISLDGGVIKGKGKLLLGYSEPKITFPVVSVSPKLPLDQSKAPQDVTARIREMDDKKRLLETIQTKIIEMQKDHEKLLKKFNKKKRKFDKILVELQPCGIQSDQCTPVKREKFD